MAGTQRLIYKFKIVLNGNNYDLTNLGGYLDYTFSHARVEDQIFSRTTFDGEIRILRKDMPSLYDELLILWNDINRRCEEVEVICDKDCQDEYWKGVFTTSQMEWNSCTCEFRIKPNTLDEYKCVLDNWELEKNFYKAQRTLTYHLETADVTYQSFPVATVTLSNTDYLAVLSSGLEPRAVDLFNHYDPDTNYRVMNPVPNTYDDWPLSSDAIFVEPFNDRWGTGLAAGFTDGADRDPFFCMGFNRVTTLPSGDIRIETFWHRDVLLLPIGSPILPIHGDGWILIGDDGLNDKYYRCPQTSCADDQGFHYGRKIESVADCLTECIDCFDSHFFDFGSPTGTKPSNIAYNDDYWHDVSIHQKSDIKRPNSNNPATEPSFIWTFKDFTDHLRAMYNVYWFINENGCIQFEHISFFEGNNIDIQCEEICNLNINTDIPKVQNFKWMDEGASDYFKGSGILYSDNCFNSEKEDFEASNVSTDICEIQSDPDKFDDSGFVFISSFPFSPVINAVYIGNYPNSFTFLHKILWRHDMYLPSAIMDGEPQTALSQKPYKFTNEITCKCLCKLEVGDVISTNQGDAEVIEYTENMNGFYQIKMAIYD